MTSFDDDVHTVRVWEADCLFITRGACSCSCVTVSARVAQLHVTDWGEETNGTRLTGQGRQVRVKAGAARQICGI